MLRQDGRLRDAPHDVAQDPQPGGPGDVGNDHVQLQIHLHESLLHAIHHRARALDQGVAVPQVGTKRRDLGGRSEAPAEKADAVQLL